MDEIDHIIIHSLRQIGCDIEDDVTSLAEFTPETLVQSAAKCLILINPDVVVPMAMPSGMAQRFSATTTLADACVSIGFRGDIGYQTFLYSNVIEVRRVLMFLIERLPKEIEQHSVPPTDKLSKLELEVANSIRLQVNAAWTPQYCKKYGIVRLNSKTIVQGSANPFVAHKVIIPHVTQPESNIPNELRDYWLKRSPTLFQQVKHPNLCATLIQKNDADRLLNTTQHSFNQLISRVSGNTTKIKSTVQDPLSKEQMRNVKSVQQLTLNNVQIPNENDIICMPEISATDALAFDVEKLKQSLESGLQAEQQMHLTIKELKTSRATANETLVELGGERKIKERTQILLENPAVNLEKMKDVLRVTEARLDHLAEQWKGHRLELMKELEQADSSTSSQNSQQRKVAAQIQIAKDKTTEIGSVISTKSAEHTKLISELEQLKKTISRNDYTSRILEIISNIRKQKTDIDRVLYDTRMLQKEINNVSGQLDRQFTVTDDLLFRNAKRDEHSKNAYKFMVALHADCGDLVRLVQETGAAMRDVRDLEDQIETEKGRNVAANLARISDDLQVVQHEGQELMAILNRTINKP